jgi:hypothetical protein
MGDPSIGTLKKATASLADADFGFSAIGPKSVTSAAEKLTRSE